MINKLTLHKAPGLNGISPNVIKVLNEENKKVLFQICCDYFNDNLDIKVRKIGKLKILPKKGDISNPNNWRGINLLDVISKLVSIVLTRRLHIVLEKEGTPIQIGASIKLVVLTALFPLKLCFK